MKTEKRKEDRSLYALVLVFVLLASGIVTAGYFYYKNYEGQYRLGVERQLSSIAQLKADELVAWRRDRLGDGKMFYLNEVFAGNVKRFLQDRNDRDAATRVRTWVRQVQKAYDYDLVMLVDPQLRMLAVYPENKEPVRLVIDKKTTETLHSGNIAFQDFYRNDQDDRIYLKVLVPILENGSPKRLIGVLALRIDPDKYLYPLINRWPVPSGTSETLIIRREGNEALFLNELRFQKSTALNLRISLSNTRVAAVKAALGQEGIIEAIDYRGVPVVADVRAIPGSPWFLVARMDASEVYAPLRERLWEMVGLIGVLLFGAVAGVGGVWRHQRAGFYRRQYETVEALNASELRYRRLFEAAKDGILILDADTGMVVDVNPFLIELLGLSHEEFLRKEIWDLGFFKDVAESKAHFLELQEKKYIRYKDLPLKTANGKQINVEFVSNIYQVDHQNVAQCNIRDITERKRAEEALRESQSLYHSFIEQLPNPVFRKDREGRYVLVNPEFCRLKGLQKEDFIGRKPLEVAVSEMARQGAEGQATKYADVGEDVHQQILRTRKTFKTEEVYPSTNGGTLHMYVVRMPVFDSRGTIIGSQGIMFDVSEHMRAKEALLESERKYRLIADHADDWIYWRAPDGSLRYISPSCERVTGYSLAEFTERPSLFEEITHPDDRMRFVQHAETLLSDHTSEDLEFRIITKSGAIRWISHTCSPVYDQDGKYAGRRGTNRNITDRKHAEEEIQKLNAELEKRVIERTGQLEAANKELEAFSYSVSHDLRAPLRAVDGFSRIVLEEYGKKLDPEAGRLLNVICANTQKMDELITDLLDLSRVSRNEMKLTRVAMAMLANSIYQEAASPDVRGQFSFSVAAIPDAYCDPILIKQVWRNLISNALKFTAPKDERKIEIGGRSEDGMDVYFIRDTGVGFDPQYTHKLFGVFQRLHKAEEFEGTGVGLAIVQRIIQRHGGKVWAEGKVGEGATFWFSIPNRQQATGNSQ